jgi:capsid portal protein
MTYRSLCVHTGQDKHILGSGYWEVTRDMEGKPERLIWAPAWSIRAKLQSNDLLAVKTPAKRTAIHWTETIQLRRFRSYVQIDASGNVVSRYKEYGDPRIMSRATGKYYDTLEDLHKAETAYVVDDDGKQVAVMPQPATELLSFHIPYAGSAAYGKPKWTPNYPDLLGMRDLSEENRLVVTDQAIPNLLLLVGGARSDPADITRIEDKIESREPGEKQILVLHANPAKTAPTTPTPTPTIEAVKLRDVQNTDGLGLNYIKQADRNLRRSYRMPKVGLGDDENVNRSTAYAMFRYTEDQVYEPERDEFADVINDKLLPSLGIQMVHYRTLTRTPKDPELLANMIATLAAAGVLTPDEGRDISEQIFNRDFKDLDGPWTKLPVTILNAVLQTKNQLTAAAILNPDEAAEDGSTYLDRLREAIIGDLERAGLQTQRSKTKASGNDDQSAGGDEDEPEGGRGEGKDEDEDEDEDD